MRGNAFEGMTRADYMRLNLTRPLTEPHLTPRAAGTGLAPARYGTPDKPKKPRPQLPHAERTARALRNRINPEPMRTLRAAAYAWSCRLRAELAAELAGAA